MNKKNENIEDNENIELLTVNLENGDNMECQILSILEINNQKYIYLLPTDSKYQSEEGEFFIYRYFEDENEEITLDNELSDEEFEMAADAFDELLDSNEYDEIIRDTP